jgi:hypothetical protein
LEVEGKETLGQPDTKGWLKEIYLQNGRFFILIRARAMNVFVVQKEGKLKNT